MSRSVTTPIEPAVLDDRQRADVLALHQPCGFLRPSSRGVIVVGLDVIASCIVWCAMSSPFVVSDRDTLGSDLKTVVLLAARRLACTPGAPPWAIAIDRRGARRDRVVASCSSVARSTATRPVPLGVVGADGTLDAPTVPDVPARALRVVVAGSSRRRRSSRWSHARASSRRCSCSRVRLPARARVARRRRRRPPPLARSVLRHSRAPARRGRPAALSGRQDRDRAADRERLLLRLRVPRADPRGGSREDRGRDPARARRRAAPGSARRSRPRRRSSASSRRTSRTRSSSSTPPRATISLLHAGRLHRPLPRPAPPGLEADQGGQADRRSPARTGAATSRTRS